jgi:two-component system nitrogen regulation response regulator GlnG
MNTKPDSASHDEAKTILVCEDESLLRGTLVRDLQRSGYVVLEASSGETAALLLHGHVIDLLITDVRLPGINGWELVQRARSDRARLPVIVMSAYGKTDKYGKIADRGSCIFLDKPFPMATLREEVKRALTDNGRTLKEARD